MSHRHHAGKLRTLCQIEQHNGAVDDRGSRDDSAINWTTEGELWADVRPLMSSEAEHAHQRHANATHKVEFRRMASLPIGPHHRLRVKGTNRLLNIGGAFDVNERRRKIQCLAVEELSPWTPAEISPAVWLHAADLSATLEQDDAVAAWSDRSGNAQHFTQGAAGATFNAGELPGVQFDAAGWLKAPDNAARADWGAWLAVITPNNDSEADVASAAYDHTASELASLTIGTAGNNPAARYYSAGFAGSAVILGSAARQLVTLSKSTAGAGAFQQNAGSASPVTLDWSGEMNAAADPINLTIGGKIATTAQAIANAFSGKLHELIILNEWDFTAPALDQLQADLLRRWQIS